MCVCVDFWGNAGEGLERSALSSRPATLLHSSIVEPSCLSFRGRVAGKKRQVRLRVSATLTAKKSALLCLEERSARRRSTLQIQLLTDNVASRSA